MHPVMRRRGIAGIRAGWIRIPKIVELLFDLWMIAKMNSTGIIWTALVPTLDVIRNQRSALQRNAIEKRFNLFRRWRASEFAISHSADDFVTERTVGIGAKSNGEEPDKNKRSQGHLPHRLDRIHRIKQDWIQKQFLCNPVKPVFLLVSA